MFASSPLNLSSTIDKRQISLPIVRQPSIEASLEPDFITISNKKTKYQLKHGENFKGLLEPRDQVLEHEFSFQQEVMRDELRQKQYKFIGSQLYKNILEKIKCFLVEAIDNVVSIAFNFLCTGQLEESEAKQYASKNMMLNVHSIVSQTIRTLQQNDLLKYKINSKDLKSNLTIQVDSILQNILLNLSDNYPQASASGGTPRMREVITELNRASDEQNDFIYTNKIKISDYLHVKKNQAGKQQLIFDEQADYTQFIMKVLNMAINVAQDTQEDSRERNVSEIFTAFNQQLFWISQEKKYQDILKTLDSRQKTDVKSKREEQQHLKKLVCGFFDTILQTNEQKLMELLKILRKQAGTSHNLSNNILLRKQEDDEGYSYILPKVTESISIDDRVKDELGSLWQETEEGIEQMKKRKRFGIGQKIPSSVKGFSRQEISNKQFTAKHSSILRILTKWAGYLQKVFQNSEEVIKQRLYPFKNIHNQLINLKENDKEGAPKLIYQLNEEYIEVKKKFQAILKNSYGFIGNFFSDGQSISSFVHRYTSTRAISSKINTVLTSFMLNYTNILIHHLLKAGQQIYTEQKYQNINLVVFRVSDLLRSKLQCSESSFISILKTIQSMRGKFKLVRIKNKLDEPANNIMINYLFMGKVQCQLQLSIQEAKGKEKNFYILSHFAYELTRGKFGSIAECAIMISQLDPMIAACKESCYTQKRVRIPLSKSSQSLADAYQSVNYDLKISRRSAQILKKIKYCLFQCAQCSKLISNENSNIFPADPPQSKLCFQCVIKKQNCEEYLNQQWRPIFRDIRNKRLFHYQLLYNLESEKCLVNLSTSGEISLIVVLYIEKEFKTFTIKMDSKVLESIDADRFNFSQLDYLDISDRVKKKNKLSKNPQLLAYMFNSLQQIPQQLFTLLQLKKQAVEKSYKRLVAFFRQFRQEVNIIRSIKYKAEIIKTSKQQWNILDRVCKNLVLGEGKQYEKKSLKYNRYKHLDLTNLKQINATRTGLTKLSRWLKQCHNLKILDLNWNSIEQIRKEQLPPFLTRLSLNYNRIKSIDISSIGTLTQLQLNRNELTSFELGSNNNLMHLDLNRNRITSLDFGTNNSLKSLRVSYNIVEEVKYLPPSLQKLEADKKVAIRYDFKDMFKLRLLWVFNGKVKRQALNNLGLFVQLHNWT